MNLSKDSNDRRLGRKPSAPCPGRRRFAGRRRSRHPLRNSVPHSSGKRTRIRRPTPRARMPLTQPKVGRNHRDIIGHWFIRHYGLHLETQTPGKSFHHCQPPAAPQSSPCLERGRNENPTPAVWPNWANAQINWWALSECSELVHPPYTAFAYSKVARLCVNGFATFCETKGGRLPGRNPANT